MAGSSDANALLLTLSADNSRLLKGLDQVNARLDQAGIDLPKKAKKAVDGIQNAYSGLNRMQGMEVAHSIRASFDALAAGAPPLRVLAMEAPRLVQAMGSGQGGLAGALSGLKALINPTTVALGGIAGVMVAGVIAAKQHADGVKLVDQAIAGLGRTSGATTGEVEDIAAAQASAGTITEGAAKKIEAALLNTGQVTAQNLGLATSTVREFAQVTKSDLDDATKVLAKAFEDPAKGAVELGEKYGLLNGAEVAAIKTMQEHGDKAGALSLLLRDLDKELKTQGGVLKDHADGWAGVSEVIHEAWENLGKYVALSVGLGSTSEKLKTLLSIRDTLIASGETGQLPDIDAQISGLKKQQDAADALTKSNAAAAKANQDSVNKEEAAKKNAAEAAKAAAAAAKAARQADAREELETRAQLDAATSAGDTAEQQRLQDHLTLLGKEKAYISAGLTSTQAQIAAERDLKVNQQARTDAQAAAIDGMQREAALRTASIAGDQASVDHLQRENELERLTLDYQKQGQTYEQAHASALADANAAQDALNAKRARETADLHDQAALQAASMVGDQRTVDLIQDRLDREKLIEDYRRQGQVMADAEKSAAQDLLAIETARAAQRAKVAQQAQLEYQIELAAAAGDQKRLELLQERADVQRRTDEKVANGDDKDLAGFLSQAEVDGLKKAAHTAANDFETLNTDLGNISSAFEQHDWGGLTKSLASAITGLQKAFGPDGTLEGKIGAVAGITNQIGGLVGGKAGGALQGASGGAMLGMQIGSIIPGIGNVVGGVLGGIGGAISSLIGNDKTRDNAAQQADAARLQTELEAIATAAEKAAEAQQTYSSDLQEFYTASGNASGALAEQRKQELQGLDAATTALKEQTFAWQDYNTALDTANDNVSSAQDALKSAFQSDQQALQSTIDTFGQFEDSLKSLRQSLNEGDLAAGTAAQSYAAAAKVFDQTFTSAKGLDQTALGGFPQTVQDFLTASKANAGSSLDYARDLAKAKNATDALTALTGNQVSVAQQQLDAESAQVQTLVDINGNVITVAQAVANLQAALTAKASISAPLTSAPSETDTDAAASDPTKNYTSTNGDFAAYVDGNPDLLAQFNAQTGLAKGKTKAQYGQEHWTLKGEGESRPVRPFWTGGSFDIGGMSGIDKNLMSLNGTPIARVSQGERVTITPRDQMGGGGSSDDIAGIRRAAEATAMHVSLLNKRMSRIEKLGMPVRALDPSQPIQVQEVA